MKLDLKPFERRVEKKLLSRQQIEDRIIYNYTPEVQWGKQWDKYTRMARGLIVKEDGTILARPFPKFFNLEERQETMVKNLPTSQPEITEKMDGSLGILYFDGTIHRIATRGSFTSDQAQWATLWLRTHRPHLEYVPDITYLFEIIYPDNRIVVDYGKREELVMIGMIHNWTGKIYPFKEVRKEAQRLGFSYPKEFNMSIDQIKQKATESRQGFKEEGFVLLYPEEQLQIKVKYADYVRLHRLIFGISVKSIWEAMAEGHTVEEAFSDAPDEVMEWIKQWKYQFLQQEQFHLDKATNLLNSIQNMDTRREQALYLKEYGSDYLGVVFTMLDGKVGYKKTIYKKFMPSIEDRNKSFKVIPVGEV